METTQAETLEAFEEATGTKWTVNPTTTDEQVTKGSKLLAGGDFEGAFMLVRATAFGKIGDLPENYAKDGTLANELLGLKQESVKEMVARLL